MMNSEFEKYAGAIDVEVSKLPILKTWMLPEDEDKKETDDLLGFVKSMTAMLGYLKAKEIFIDGEPYYSTPIEFKHFDSPYTRIGAIGKANKLNLDENTIGVIAIGFDEGLDYEEKDWNLKPSLMVCYRYGSWGEDVTDIHLFDSKNWKNALYEFFDIRKAINPPAYINESANKPRQKNFEQLKLES